jgi:hypothetical protein
MERAGRRAAAALLALIFVKGPMWFAPRGLRPELNHNWCQAAACASFVVVGVACLIAFAFVSAQRSASSRLSAGSEGVDPGSTGQATAAIKNAPLTRK